MADELERLQINIDADASGAEQGVNWLKKVLAKLAEYVRRVVSLITGGMGKAARSTDGLTKATQKVAAATKQLDHAGKLENLTRIYEALSDKATIAKQKIEQLRAEIKEMSRKTQMTGEKGSTLGLQEKLANEELKYAKLIEQVDKAAQKVWQLEDAIAQGTPDTGSLDETASATENVGNQADKAAPKFGRLRREIEHTGRKGPTIMHSLGRSLRSMLIITAVSRGVMNFVRWLGRAYAADKQVAASLSQIKASLTTAFAPIYNAALPAIRALISALASVCNWIAKFITSIARLFGISTDTSGITGIGSAAGGAAKEMNELIASFDELNKLDNKSGSGGGGGGGGGGGLGDLNTGTAADGLENFNTLGEGTKKVLEDIKNTGITAAASITGVGLALKFVKFIGGSGWGAGTTLTAGAYVTAGISGLMSASEIMDSDWYKNSVMDTLKVMQNGTPTEFLGAMLKHVGKSSLAGIVNMIPGVNGAEWVQGLEKNKWNDIFTSDRPTFNRTDDFSVAGLIDRLGVHEADTSQLDALKKNLKKQDKFLTDFLAVPYRTGTIESWRRKRAHDLDDLARKQMEADFRLLGDSMEESMKSMTQKLKGYDMGSVIEWALGVDSGTTNRITGKVSQLGSALKAELVKSGQDIKDGILEATRLVTEAGTSKGGTSGSGSSGSSATTSKLKQNLDAASQAIKNMTLTEAVAVLGDNLKSVLGFASGGMNIAKGQLFIANENGAEMIGTIGGKTAVANQQEISGAIWREMQQYKTGGGDAGDIADAVARALNGTSVKVGERQFGTLVVQAVNKNARQAGRVDFAF